MPVQLVLIAAVIGISFAGPLVRLSTSHPLTIAIWRLIFSLLIIGSVLVATGQWRQWKRLDRTGLGLSVGAGAMLALHFWSWNASVSLTTVSASVILVDIQPVIVGVLSVLWLSERPTRKQWIGIGIALAGTIIVALPDVVRGGASAVKGSALFGDGLALIGAFTAALYVVAGRRLRATLDLWPYVGLVYGSCLAALLVLAVAVHAPVLGPPPREMAIFAGLALGPMLLGHTGFAYALRYLPAYIVNLCVLGETVGATILAAVIPWIHELPTMMTLAGGAVILGGIYLASDRPPTVVTVSRD